MELRGLQSLVGRRFSVPLSEQWRFCAAETAAFWCLAGLCRNLMTSSHLPSSLKQGVLRVAFASMQTPQRRIDA
eukprot:scaffold11_cov257-Pinguiococcus_pyrenoidosus.AAC.21